MSVLPTTNQPAQVIVSILSETRIDLAVPGRSSHNGSPPRLGIR